MESKSYTASPSSGYGTGVSPFCVSPIFRATTCSTATRTQASTHATGRTPSSWQERSHVRDASPPPPPLAQHMPIMPAPPHCMILIARSHISSTALLYWGELLATNADAPLDLDLDLELELLKLELLELPSNTPFLSRTALRKRMWRQAYSMYSEGSMIGPCSRHTWSSG